MQNVWNMFMDMYMRKRVTHKILEYWSLMNNADSAEVDFIHVV